MSFARLIPWPFPLSKHAGMCRSALSVTPFFSRLTFETDLFFGERRHQIRDPSAFPFPPHPSFLSVLSALPFGLLPNPPLPQKSVGGSRTVSSYFGGPLLGRRCRCLSQALAAVPTYLDFLAIASRTRKPCGSSAPYFAPAHFNIPTTPSMLFSGLRTAHVLDDDLPYFFRRWSRSLLISFAPPWCFRRF